MTAHVRKAGRLGRRRRWALYIVGTGVWLTGGLWLLFHYFFVEEGEFGPTANPLEPWWLKLHGAFAFAAVWMFGLLWGIHIAKLWPHRRRRWSGGILTGVFVLLILSGYLLYYLGDDRIRPLISALHWVIGLACPIFFAWHRLRRRVIRPPIGDMNSAEQQL
jgi:hypothetical protein